MIKCYNTVGQKLAEHFRSHMQKITKIKRQDLNTMQRNRNHEFFTIKDYKERQWLTLLM